MSGLLQAAENLARLCEGCNVLTGYFGARSGEVQNRNIPLAFAPANEAGSSTRYQNRCPRGGPDPVSGTKPIPGTERSAP